MTLSGRLDWSDARLDRPDRHRLDRQALARAVLLAIAVVALVLVRAVAAHSGSLDGLAIGLAFGLGLVAIGAPGRRVRLPRATELALGVAAGLALVGIALVGPGAGMVFRPAADFAPWAAVTVLVASAEELVLRGALFDAVEDALGVLAAIALTSVVFALMHVPLYGWHVVPLDLGVGVLFAGLRLMSGGVVAPALAHTLGDLATWWL
jgi:hypothetical protein